MLSYGPDACGIGCAHAVNFAALHLSYAAILSPATYVRGAFHCLALRQRRRTSATSTCVKRTSKF